MEINLELLFIQNPWWHYGRSAREHYNFSFDPVIREYENHACKWQPEILDRIELRKDAITILEGPRGVGKTTILKLLIRRLIERDNIDPDNIFYYSCHNIETNEQLNELIKVFLDQQGRSPRKRRYIFVDEITLVKNWDKGISYLAKAGRFRDTSVILTGSLLDKYRIESAGTKIRHEIVASLNFNDFLALINPNLARSLGRGNYGDYRDKLDYYLDIYYLTGGFIAGVNSFQESGAIKQSVYSNYLYWLTADIAKLNRDLALMRQTMEQVILNLGRTVGYKTIAKKTKAKTHLTAAEYLNILEAMFAVKLVYQLGDDNKPDTRKAKKVYFRDPFLFWLFDAYIHGSIDYWRFSREHLYRDNILDRLTETAVFSHLIKNGDGNGQVSYWRDTTGKKEIDFLVTRDRKTMPIMIERDGLAPAQCEKIFAQAGFSQGIIISKHDLGQSGKIIIVPLTYFLLFYDELI